MNWGDYLYYSEGKLYWLHRSKNGACQPGKEAGYMQPTDGRWVVGLNGRTYKRARIVWEMLRGPIPKGAVIDHINRVRSDDRIENLRAVDVLTNNKNKTVDRRNQSGVSGVRWDPIRGKWEASIGRTRLGRFLSKEAAISARLNAEQVQGYLRSGECIK